MVCKWVPGKYKEGAVLECILVGRFTFLCLSVRCSHLWKYKLFQLVFIVKFKRKCLQSGQSRAVQSWKELNYIEEVD